MSDRSDTPEVGRVRRLLARLGLVRVTTPHEHSTRCFAGSFDEYHQYGPGPFCGRSEAPYEEAHGLVGVGVYYCIIHEGVMNEDDESCDFSRIDTSDVRCHPRPLFLHASDAPPWHTDPLGSDDPAPPAAPPPQATP